jgi:heat shock protein HslJ
MKKKIYYTLFLFFTLGICIKPVLAQKNKKDKNAIWFSVPAATVVFDWVGTYKGTIPCADCQGVQIVLQLHKDNTYKQITKFVGKGDEVFTEEGSFLWKKEGAYIVLLPTNHPLDSCFGLLAKDKLTILDNNGKRIGGANAAFYILTKDNMLITGKYWQLVELNGKPLPEPKGNKEPFIYLGPTNNSFNAHGGCNTLMGTYELGANNHLGFAGLVSTMMACPAMDTEEAIKLALESTDHFVLRDDYLILENALKQPLAKFIIVYLR